jgi:ribosome-associated protein
MPPGLRAWEWMKDWSNGINSIDLAAICARTAEEKKGEEIRVLDMEGVFPMADYFVLATGANRKHIQSITEAIVKTLKGEEKLPLSREGYGQGWWVLVDYGDVVVHILSQEARKFYDLENLWGDAQDVDWSGMKPRETGS